MRHKRDEHLLHNWALVAYHWIANVLVNALVFTRNITSISNLVACRAGDITESIISSYRRWGRGYWLMCFHPKLMNCLSMKLMYSLSFRWGVCLVLFLLWWGIDFTHGSRAPPVDKSSPELLLMNKQWLHHWQPILVCAEVHRRGSEKRQIEPFICYYLVFNGLSHIHFRDPVLSLVFLPLLEAKRCSRLAWVLIW